MKPGRNGRSLWAGWGWGRMPLSWLVAIAIRPSDEPAKALRHIGDFALFRRDGKVSPGSHRNSPHMRPPTGEPLWDHGSHHIPRLKPEIAFVPLAMAYRKPQGIDAGTAVGARVPWR